MEEKNELHKETEFNDGPLTSYTEAKDNSSHTISPSAHEVMKKSVPWISLGDIREPPPREYIVEILIPKCRTTAIYGDGANGKSHFALTLATCVAAGLPFCSMNTFKGPVFYVDFELDEDEIGRIA